MKAIWPIGSLHIRFLRWHIRYELRRYCARKRISRSDCVAALHSRLDKIFDHSWPEQKNG